MLGNIHSQTSAGFLKAQSAGIVSEAYSGTSIRQLAINLVVACSYQWITAYHLIFRSGHSIKADSAVWN